MRRKASKQVVPVPAGMQRAPLVRPMQRIWAYDLVIGYLVLGTNFKMPKIVAL